MPSTLVQLSDPHVTANGLAYGRVDTNAAFARAVASVGRLPQAPDAVLVSGDLVDAGSAAEYARFRALLAPLECPVYLLPGNHDERGALQAAFPDHPWLASCPGGWVQYAIELAPGFRLVAADSVVAGAPHGEIDAARLAHLDALLAADPTSRTIVALHHPPFVTGLAFMDTMLLANPEALAEVIARHPQVERVACGHLHRSIQARWAGTIAMTAPSTAHQLAFDLAPDAPPGFTLEPPALLVHVAFDEGPLVTHMVTIGEAATAHAFE